MLNLQGAKRGAEIMVTDMWTADEFSLIAKELKERFPKKGYGNFYNLSFTPDQVEEAAETVLPQHRHKSVMDYLDIRRPMFDAFTKLANPGVKTPSLSVVPGHFDAEGRIKWSIQEWEAVILELHEICPDAFAKGLKTIGVEQVRKAMEVLEIPRRCQFKQVVGFKEQALRIWQDLPEEIKDPSKQDRPIVDFASGPVMAPPLTSKTSQHPMAAALQKAFTEPPKQKIQVITEKPRKKRVSWDDGQWLQIAREMHRQDPFGNLLTSSFSRIDLAAIKAAQSKIFSWENHKALKNSESLHAPLIAAFAALKVEIGNKDNHPNDEVEVKTAPVVPAKELTPGQKRTAAAIAARLLMTPEQRKEAARKGHVTRAAKKLELKKEATEWKAETARINIAISQAKMDVMPSEEVKEVGPVVPESAQLSESVTIRPAPVQAEKPAPFIPLPANEMAFFGKVLNAALPLMNVLIDEAVARLAPSLIAGLLPQLEKTLGGIVERAVAEKVPTLAPQNRPTIAPVAMPVLREMGQEEAQQVAQQAPVIASGPLSKAELAQYLPQPKEKVKKPKIALVMPTGQQREQMRTAFPEYEFVFIDHGQGIKEAAQSCVFFVALNAYVNEANRPKIKAHVPPENLKFVEGGISALKREINVWKVTQKG